ncbi:hypothetical protein [Mesorhizobium sp. B2-1-3A]|uniref:hypothetical protein n=1 Tax=Mesorhizobium sp. B2-1-3A TaxID=2589971 RepID=UPI00112AE057|nr:hypothetical protein [Mesorhizobium sp. B2-1-3A]TPM90634.1 hypothetical protein FJ977_33700 [Mesorhizobium sp. B2-1-3A]
MTDPTVPPGGMAYPDDLALLKCVYDHVCQEQGIADGSSEAADLAARAMALFSQGVVDEALLREHLKRSGPNAG